MSIFPDDDSGSYEFTSDVSTWDSVNRQSVGEVCHHEYRSQDKNH